MDDVRRHGRRHKAVGSLRDAEIDKIDTRCDQGRIKLGGPQKVLQPILHAMALEGLPLVVGALKDLVGFAVFVVRRWRGFGDCRDSEAFAGETPRRWGFDGGLGGRQIGWSTGIAA